MAIRSITQLKKWFRRGMYPTESQFADWIDSFWHKEEDRIPMSTIEGLPEVINNKYPATAGKELEQEVNTLTADLAAHKVESEYKFNRINEDITDLETTDEEIQADLVTVHQDITNLQATDAQLSQQIGTKADANHTHTQYAATNHNHAGVYQPAGDYATTNHTHTGYVTTDHTHTKSQITDFPASMPANGGNADTVGGLHADNIARGGIVVKAVTGNGWFRIAKIKNDTGSAIFTILNYWNNNRPSSVTFIVSTEYKGLPEHGAAITQIGGNSYIIQKARIIGSTNSNECYLDIYINQNTAGNPWVITCSNAINFSLIEPIASVVPNGYTINLEQTFKTNYTNLTAKAAEGIAGQLIIANQNNTDGHGGAIHLREYDRQSDDSNFYNAPAITFHWAGKYVKRLGMHSNGHLYFGENDDRLAYARELPSVSVQASAPASGMKDGDIWIKP